MDFDTYVKTQNFLRLIEEDFAWFLTDGFVEGIKGWPMIRKWLGPTKNTPAREATLIA